MQNQNMQTWTWGQTGTPASTFPAAPVFPPQYPPPSMDQNQIMAGYQQMYGAAPASQPPPDYGASQWSAAQLQHWQQWQQWQEKYQEWQAQYGKKYAETIAAMGQTPSMVMPPSVTGVKPVEEVVNPGYTTVNPPPPPSTNAQPVPPPPPEEDKTSKPKMESKPGYSTGAKESPEELSEAERTFDVQFKQWEDQFNEWKKQNQDHPDKVQYREYEKKWETWREQLLQRREEMRRKRLNKAAESGNEGKTEAKVEQDRQGKSSEVNTGVGYRTSEGPNQQLQPDSKPSGGFSGSQDAAFPQLHKEGNPLMAPGGYHQQQQDNQGRFFDREAPNFGSQFSGLMDGQKRFDVRNDFNQRRSMGNGGHEDDRARPSYGNRPFVPKDGKFGGNSAGPQLNEQAFGQSSRNNYPGDSIKSFNSMKNNSPFNKPKVPSLFDITVEKPPGLRSPGKERKPKIWEEQEDEKKEEKRNESPWLSNVAWAKSNNSPWIKPWELDRVIAEKPPDANLRPDAWQKEDGKPWAADVRKPDMDQSELSGYVGKILAKLGNFNVLPPNAGDGGDAPTDGKLPFVQNQPWNKTEPVGLNPAAFGAAKDVVLFGKGDCDDRIRYDRDRFGRRGGNEDRGPFRREGPFQDDRVLGSRPDDRFFGGKGDDAGKFGPDDIDERVGRGRNGGGRRGFEDRDDRPFRGGFDRDERRNRGNFGSPFERPFNRGGDSGSKDLEWNPQVFDYSKGPPPNYRSRFNDTEDNFRISTVVDYSHGENKQTFDYAHGEMKNDVKSFDYGHGKDAPAVIDYGHGSDRNIGGPPPHWKRDSDQRDRSRSKSRSPQQQQVRGRSPRSGRMRSRSRSPYSRNRRDSNSPPYRGGHRSRSRDRFNRGQMGKRNRRNNSEEKPVQNQDGDMSKNNFDVTTVLVEDLICSPGRETRPSKLVFIMRGLPGSGKTYVTKLIKDKEVELGGDAPRILSLDDYFMTEVEKEVVDEETGRKMKKKVLEYEYESGAEPHYRGSLLKAFKKTVSDGFFSFIIVDSVNEKTKDFEEMWSFAKSKGFQVYVAEMDDDVAVCTKRNIHKRTEKEISDLSKAWEKTPTHYLRLDVRSLLQAAAITEVEMEVVSDTDIDKVIEGKADEKEGDGDSRAADADADADDGADDENNAKEDEDEDEPGDESAFVKSRWDHFENSEQKLDRLDGLKRRREGFHTTMEDYLQLPDDFDLGSSEPTDGKKKVRWADLEERRQQEKMRAIGFVVGQTDWSRMTDPTFGESALTRTKYI